MGPNTAAAGGGTGTYKESLPAGADVLQPAQPRDALSRAGWWDIFSDGRLNDLENS